MENTRVEKDCCGNIKIPKGYRKLNIGENKLEGDLFSSYSSNTWVISNDHNNKFWKKYGYSDGDSRLTYIRKIEEVKVCVDGVEVKLTQEQIDYIEFKKKERVENEKYLVKKGDVIIYNSGSDDIKIYKSWRPFDIRIESSPSIMRKATLEEIEFYNNLQKSFNKV